MFGFNKVKKLEQQINEYQKQMSDQRVTITQQNELMRALYDELQTFLPLQKDSNLKKYVQEGFESNTDTFGILMKLATIFSRIPVRLVQVQSNGKEKELFDHEILSLYNRPNYFQNGIEFRMAWALFKYVTGNSIVYAPKYEAGQNRGRINRDGLSMMPTQNVEIVSKGFQHPIGHYQLDLDISRKIKPSDVWHERVPSLQYENGQNFMGLSPLKTAMNVINLQNAGQEMAAKHIKGGHPPGIISKEEEGGSTTQDQESAFRQKWKSKYQKDIDIPIFTMGKLNYTKIGYDNFKDLQLLEMDKNGRLKLCIALQVPPENFGASEPTYNNMQAAKKAMYEDRVIPDFEQYLNGLNEEVVKAYGERLKLKPDYSQIEVLQEDKEKKAKVMETGMKNGAYSPNDFREAMGDERLDEPGMDERYIGSGQIPLSMGVSEEMPVSENNREYDRRGVSNGM